MKVEKLFWESEVKKYKIVLMEWEKEIKVKEDKLVVELLKEVEK